MDGFSAIQHSFDLTGQVLVTNFRPEFRGTYSDVYRGVAQGAIVAVKVIHATGKPHAMRRKILRERRIWSSLNHRNIHPFYGFADDQAFAPFGALVSPWCNRGDANQFLEEHGARMTESERIKLWTGVVDGVTYLHLHNPVVVHGDLKPGNVLIDDSGRPRICDFGLSQMYLEGEGAGLTTTSEHTGTERYLAPELVMSEVSVCPTTESDVYALGCLGLEFIRLQRPYSHRKNNLRGQIIIDLRKGIPPAPDPPRPCSQVWGLLRSCWNNEPARRPSAAVVSQTLEAAPKAFPINVVERIIYFVAGEDLHRNNRSEAKAMIRIRRDRVLKKLGLVSWSWWSIAIPHIYREIYIYFRKERWIKGLNKLFQSLISPTVMLEFESYGHIVQYLTLDTEALYPVPCGDPQILGNAYADLVRLTRWTPALQRLQVIHYDIEEYWRKPYVPAMYSESFDSSLKAYFSGIWTTLLWKCLPNLNLVAALQSLQIDLPVDIVSEPLAFFGVHLPNLRHLAIRECSSPNLAGVGALVVLLSLCCHWTMPNLASLRIISRRNHDGVWSVVRNLLHSCGANLEHLSLDFVDELGGSLAEVLQLCTKLRSIVSPGIGYSQFVRHESLAHITYIWRDSHREWLRPGIDQSMLFNLKRDACRQFPSLNEIMLEFRQKSEWPFQGEVPTSSAYMRADESVLDIWDAVTVYRYVEGNREPLVRQSPQPLSLSVPYRMQVPSGEPW